jgi:uncharacterized protein (DUF427 family)
MALTRGTAPFGEHPAGEFNRDMPALKGLIYFEDSPRRIRAVFAGETVVDSRRAKLLHEHGHLPVYYFPEDELRGDLLERSDHSSHCPWKGDASYWTVRVGERVAENAVWGYEEPLAESAPPLLGYRALYWHAMDEWFEEDEPLIVHARDPYHRVDVLESSRHVKVSLDGETLAETTRAFALFETGLPTRWYIPEEDVRMDLLEASEKSTGCAYKGYASYWSVGDEEDIVWTYREPHRDVARIRDRLAFFNERVDLELDGELLERPVTPWSKVG